MNLSIKDMDVASMTTAASGPPRETRWLANAGLAIMAAAFVWWFLFYAQWTGPLRLLDLKVPCLLTTLGECSFFQARLEAFHAAGPAYHPAAWWIGVATFLAGRVSGMLLPGAFRPYPLPQAAENRGGAAGVRRVGQNDGALSE
jgi:hypothetical protein